MYIGGTDANAMHHLFAEVIDNAMDEAVAGHATYIEVSLEDGEWLSVADNGRGMPVDPHPKFPGKSALEIIMTMLHAGGKFDSGAYETSGGLHGVGVSVVNALSSRTEVEVARGQTLYRQAFERGVPVTKLEVVGKAPNRRGTRVRFHPDEQIFGKAAHFDPARLFKMTRAKAYLFGGVEIRWRCAPSLVDAEGKIPAEATFHFPGGLKDYLAADIEGQELVVDQPFTGKVEKDGKHGSVEWAIAWVGDRGRLHPLLLQHHPDRPTAAPTRRACAPALLRGLKDHAERIGQSKRAAALTADDVMSGCAALISVFIREPEFQGQNKGRLQTAEAARIVDATVRDAFDHWLAAAPSQAAKLLDFALERADERLRRRMEKDVARKAATRKLRLPGKLADCTNSSAQGSELFIVEGDSAGGSAKQARDRAIQAMLPLRGKILNVASATRDKLAQNQQLADLMQALGVGIGRAIPLGRPALRQDHHHDRRRRRRRPYRLAADHLLLSPDAEADRGRPPLSRRAAALSADPGRQVALCARRRAQGRADEVRLLRPRRDRSQPLQGPGRNVDARSARHDDGSGASAPCSGWRCSRPTAKRPPTRSSG